MPNAKRTFVLVHGAWCGSRYWRDVADILRARGHRVFTPTLTGLGEREHLLSPKVNLTTHILDIVNVIKWEELSDIVLAGHSYGGMVISGVAAKAPAGTITSIVFLDAFYPQDGQSLADIVGEEAAKQVWGDADPIPPPLILAGDDKVLREALEEGPPHPRATKFERLPSVAARERIRIKTYVYATRPPGMFQEQVANRLRADPTWRIEAIGTGHNMMTEAPQETAELLLRAAV